MTKPPIPTENSKTKGQHKNATKNFDYTRIADRLRTVSSSNNSHPTGWVKPVYGYPTFLISYISYYFTEMKGFPGGQTYSCLHTVIDTFTCHCTCVFTAHIGCHCRWSGHVGRDFFYLQEQWCTSKIEKVPRCIRGEKSSKDMANTRNPVSTSGAQASPTMGDGTRCPEG